MSCSRHLGPHPRRPHPRAGFSHTCGNSRNRRRHRSRFVQTPSPSPCGVHGSTRHPQLASESVAPHGPIVSPHWVDDPQPPRAARGECGHDQIWETRVNGEHALGITATDPSYPNSVMRAPQFGSHLRDGTSGRTEGGPGPLETGRVGADTAKPVMKPAEIARTLYIGKRGTHERAGTGSDRPERRVLGHTKA